jgi:hypothetical protein
MSEFPKMMYRKGGGEEIFGLACEMRVADTAEDESDLLQDGWCRSPFEAHDVEAPKPDPIEETSSPLDVEKDALSGEVAQLTQDLDTLQRERVGLAEELNREREAHEATKAKLAETEAMLAEATKPPAKAKETLSVKGS